MDSPLTLTEDKFDRQYPLRINHLDPHAAWAFGDDRGCLFGWSHEEIEFVCSQNPQTIWTLVEGDEGELLVISGIHRVNRLGYLISTVVRPDGLDIEVPLESAESE